MFSITTWKCNKHCSRLPRIIITLYWINTSYINTGGLNSVPMNALSECFGVLATFCKKKIAKQRQRNGRRRQTIHRTQSIIISLFCFEPLIHCPKMVIFLDIQRIAFFHFWTTFFFFRWISTAELLIDGACYKIMNI